MSAKKIHYRYKKIVKYVRSIKNQLQDDGWTPDLIVGLSRGGLTPAVLLSHELNVPMHALTWSTRDHENRVTDAATAELAIEGKKILIVDDICDSGLTFRELKKDWNSCVRDKIKWRKKVRFAVLDYKPASKFKVNYSANVVEGKEWLVYPWECTDNLYYGNIK